MLLQELLQLREAQTSAFDLNTLKTKVMQDTNRGHNSDNAAADRKQDNAVKAALKAMADHTASKEEALAFAQENLNDAVEACAGADDASEIVQAGCWGKLDGYRAIVKFLGGKINKKIANATSVYDIN